MQADFFDYRFDKQLLKKSVLVHDHDQKVNLVLNLEFIDSRYNFIVVDFMENMGDGAQQFFQTGFVFFLERGQLVAPGNMKHINS